MTFCAQDETVPSKAQASTPDRLRELASEIRNQNAQYCRHKTWMVIFVPFTAGLSDAKALELYALLPPCKCCEDDK